MKPETKQACITACITARDFCGNERQAIIDTANDYGEKATSADIADVISAANIEWRKWQKAAGGG